MKQQYLIPPPGASLMSRTTSRTMQVPRTIRHAQVSSYSQVARPLSLPRLSPSERALVGGVMSVRVGCMCGIEREVPRRHYTRSQRSVGSLTSRPNHTQAPRERMLVLMSFRRAAQPLPAHLSTEAPPIALPSQ